MLGCMTSRKPGFRQIGLIVRLIILRSASSSRLPDAIGYLEPLVCIMRETVAKALLTGTPVESGVSAHGSERGEQLCKLACKTHLSHMLTGATRAGKFKARRSSFDACSHETD